MPRQPRLDYPGLTHHVMARGIEKRDIFLDDRDRQAFLKRLAKVAMEAGAKVYAWSLMPNHFHLLLRIEGRPLSWVMRRLSTSLAVRHNQRHGRTGHLLQGRYKSVVVEEEAYLLELVRYIHLNPVRAGLLETPRDLDTYPYTGHSALLRQVNRPWQSVQQVLEWFAPNPDQAVRFYRYFIAAGFNQGAREDLRLGGHGPSLPPQERTSSDSRVLGSEAFATRVSQAEEDSPQPPVRDSGEILREVSAQHGVSAEQILGATRARRVTRARREFFRRAHEEAGISMAALGRLCGRTHTAVRKAIEKVAEAQGAGGSKVP